MAQGRRVRRVLRKIDSWSVLKVSSLFFASFVLVLLLAGVLLWIAGSTVGAIDSVEKFMVSIGFEDFQFVSGQLLRGFVAAGLVLVVLGTGLSVLMAVIYNLISDVVGGIQLIVLEEATVPRTAPARTIAPAPETNGPTAPSASPPPAPGPARGAPGEPPATVPQSA